MKIAIISDVHSNLEALRAVETDITKQGVEKIFCLGDMVGFGPFPAECLAWSRKSCQQVVMGNHEYFLYIATKAIKKSSLDKKSEEFLKSLKYTYEILSFADYEWIKKLPLMILRYEFGVTLVHSTVLFIEKWNYILPKLEYIQDAELNVMFQKTPLVFCGHSHAPYVFTPEDGFVLETTVELNNDKKYLINPGSVGQSRRKNLEACYCILEIDDNEKKKIHFRFVSYDVQKTALAIKQKKLPKYFITRMGIK